MVFLIQIFKLMKRIAIDYSVEDNSIPVPQTADCVGAVDQSIVGSVFIVDPATGCLRDCLAQVLQDPTSPKSNALGSSLSITRTSHI